MNKPLIHVLLSLLMCLTLPLTATAQIVNIPDPNLRAAIEGALGKASGATITVDEMTGLTRLEARNASISDLTGLEHATNLIRLDLSWLETERDWINSNSVSNLSPLSGLPHLRELNLGFNNISDLSPLSGLPHLTRLDLRNNTIGDLSVLAELTNLRGLYLWNNVISDLSPLAGLTHLTGLGLGVNAITDISPIAELTHLTRLWLDNNSIMDISALSGLTNLVFVGLWDNHISDISPLVVNSGLGQGEEVNVRGNPLNHVSINTYVPALQSRGITVEFDPPAPFENVPFDINNIPEPVPPPQEVRDFFDLDPFYQQWINVEGFPVLASEKVNPYAVKEAAWVIYQMIGHRSDILQALVQNRARFTVMAYNEMITQVPEYSRFQPDFYWDKRNRGLGGWTASCGEENLLAYPGDPYFGMNVLIHEFAHTLHLIGLDAVDPGFDNRLRITYDAAIENGLWQGTFASTDRQEYWAELTESWFNSKEENALLHNHINTRTELKGYDPGIARLLAEVFGDSEWRYTPPVTRTHLPHLQGFNPQDSPIFEWPPDLNALYAQLSNPESDGGGKWVNLPPYDPSQLSRLNTSKITGPATEILFVNFTGEDVLVYSVEPDGTEIFFARMSGDIRYFGTYVGGLLLVKDSNGRPLTVFQAVEKTGRALVEFDNRLEMGPNKITGPWLWMIAPTAPGQGGRQSNNVDSLAAASNGDVTEADIAANGAKEGDTVGNYVWTLGKIAATGGNNINDLINGIGMAQGDVNDHSSYALITLESTTAQSNLTMRVGSDDSVKVWLNGEVVHNKPVNRGASDFQDSFKVNLKQGDNLLLVKVSERDGGWSMFVGIDADVDAVYKRPPDTVVSADVNNDGSVDVLDLILITANLDTKGSNLAADVNRDGIVNILDLVLAAGMFDSAAAAPSVQPQVPETLTAVEVQGWLTDVLSLEARDPIMKRGRMVLEQLLIYLTPKETELLANYPNPFNPETWIPYRLAEDASVTLTIYDQGGQVVRTLDVGYRIASAYETRSKAIYWDGRNDVGEPVASGVYFYTLTAGNYSATRRMVILK